MIIIGSGHGSDSNNPLYLLIIIPVALGIIMISLMVCNCSCGSCGSCGLKNTFQIYLEKNLILYQCPAILINSILVNLPILISLGNIDDIYFDTDDCINVFSIFPFYN